MIDDSKLNNVLWNYMQEDDEIIISRDNKINSRFSAIYKRDDFVDVRGKGLTIQEAIRDLFMKLRELEVRNEID